MEVVCMELSSKAMEAYLDDLMMRAASSFGVPQSIIDVELGPIMAEPIKMMFTAQEKCHYPCPIDGSYVTTSECWDCERSDNCDIYATMLDEDFT